MVKKNNFLEKIYIWNTTQLQNNNLDYMIDPTFRNINRLFALLFNNGDDDPRRNSFGKYYMPLVETKVFNALIDNKILNKINKKLVKNLLKCQETMTM